MATLVASLSRIPGLDSALEIKDLQKSYYAYNGLLDDTEQPPVSEMHIQKLAALFVRYNAHKTLGVHLIHGHSKTPENTVMLGKNFKNPCGRWTKVTEIDAVDLSIVHGHIFVLTKDGFIAYEYQDGPMPDLSSIGNEFLVDFVDYLVTNGLTNLLGLQVLLDGMDQTMWELILDQGTVMLDAAVVRGCSPTRITGWRFETRDGQPRVCMTNEKHAKMNTGNHKVFNAGKLQPKLSDVDDLKKALFDVGVL
ncbi:hypothetical protein MMC17_000878 [Xylographa soralifera]|nr:hypothetical protein [Xylographa soralifera]